MLVDERLEDPLGEFVPRPLADRDDRQRGRHDGRVDPDRIIGEGVEQFDPPGLAGALDEREADLVDREPQVGDLVVGEVRARRDRGARRTGEREPVRLDREREQDLGT